MILDHPAFEAEIHHDTYVAMLRAALHQRGDKALFAQQTRVVTREFLSYVTGKERQRNLSPRKATELAAYLPWPPEVREKFVEHVVLCQQARLRRQEAVRSALDAYEPTDLLNRLYGEIAVILSGENPEVAGLRYRVVRDLCMKLLHSEHPSVHPKQSPLNYAEICLMLCNAQGVLDRPDEALFYSKIASVLLEERDAHDARRERARHQTLHLGALRAEASAYHILDLPKMSYSVPRHWCRMRGGTTEPPAAERDVAAVDVQAAVPDCPRHGGA